MYTVSKDFSEWMMTTLIIHQIFLLTRDWSKHVTWMNMPQLKLENIQVMYSPIFKNACVVKSIWGIINTIASICHENILRYLSLDIIFSLELTCQNRTMSVEISKRVFVPNEGYCLYTSVTLKKLYIPNLLTLWIH